MKTNVVETSQWGRELTVEVEADRIEKEWSLAVRNYQKRAEIPGFRKGKVPIRIIESRYGDSIRNEVIGKMLPNLLQEATQETQLSPAASPQIIKLEHDPGGVLSFTAKLDIWPEIDLNVYEGLEITRIKHEVKDEEIDAQLKELRVRQATERSVERALEKDDVLVADLQRLDEEGNLLDGEKFEERYFVIGEENAPSQEFEEALIGISAGEERRVKFSYREDLPNEELAGKVEHFDVTAREIRERTLPELDDEFAKDIGEQFANLNELKDHLKKEIEGRWVQMVKQRERMDLISQLIEKNPFEVPESMVENYLHSTEQKGGKKSQHEHHEHHEHSDEERKTAVQRLKGYLISEAVRKKAGIEVVDEEFEEFLNERAKQAGVNVADVKRSGNVDDLRRELEEQKTFDFLVAKAVIKEESV